MKRVKLIVLILLPLLFLSCSKRTLNNHTLIPSGQYTVTVRMNNREFKGTMTMLGNGDFIFLHDDPSSPLFSLEESVNHGCYKSSFGGIEPEAEEITASAAMIRNGLALLSDQNESPKKENGLDNRTDCLVWKKTKGDITVTIAEDKVTKEPHLIRIKEKDSMLEIVF